MPLVRSQVWRSCATIAGALLLLSSPAAAQHPAVVDEELPVAYDGPPAPVAPEVFAKDAEGRITLRATRVDPPLTIDGALDEAIYQQVRPITHFVQQEPVEGQPATERTEAWVFFDNRNFYVSVRCYDSEPERLVANELRRDSFNIFQNDNVTISIDPMYTRRSGYFFQTNALGAHREQEVQDERSNNNDWNAIWHTRSRILADGWSMEFVIPFSSLRYRSAGPQVWGLNVRRVVRWKNEHAMIAPIPASAGVRAMYRFDIFATLVGVETPPLRPAIDIKPYAIAASTTNLAAAAPFRNDLEGDAGFDVKYGVTQSLVADFTYRTDFAQVEEDQQQVNLTRFSLFFPEKREFFLEGQGLFNFGGEQRGGSPTPVVFYSRRIGLQSGREVPILAGGRLAGRVGKFGLGLLNVQTSRSDDIAAPATNFSVIRLRRDVLSRSNIGLIATHRAPGTGASNTVLGVDANFWFPHNITVTGFAAESNTSDIGRPFRERASYRGEFDYSGDRYGARYEHLMVGTHFEPEVGFLRRRAFVRNYGQLRFSPRPAGSTRVRKHTFEAEFDHIAGTDGVLESRTAAATYRMELNNSDQWTVDYRRNFEFLRQPFEILEGRRIGAGGYHFSDVQTTYQFGPQRRVSGTATFRIGSFYDGRNTEVGYRGSVEVSPRFNVEPGVTLNFVDLPAGSFTARLVSTRTTYMFSPAMAVSALVQYNSTTASLSSSMRYRWEFRPGSDLFVVYSDGRATFPRRGYPDLVNRTFVVKVTRLFRM